MLTKRVKIKKTHKVKSFDIKRINEKPYFLSRTFASKFFLRLTSKILSPDIIALQILKFEPANRKKEEIEKTLPYLSTLEDFNEYISLAENKESRFRLISEIAWVLIYKFYKKYSIIKKIGEKDDQFFLNLNGEILVLNLVIKRETLTLEDYLIYLIKVKILDEKEIIKLCQLLNKEFIELDVNNIQDFCKNNPHFNYEILESKAKNDLIELGFNIDKINEEEKINIIPSVESYLKFCDFKKNIKNYNEGNKATINFFIPKYEILSIIKKGRFFGHLSSELIKENYTFICLTNCDIGFIDKTTLTEETALLDLIISKNRKVFKEIKNNYYPFHNIKEDIFLNDYAPMMIYKKYKKGDKIFLQDSAYKGIYLIKSGEVKVSIKTSIDEMSNLILYIKNSLFGFREYVSSILTEKQLEEKQHQERFIQNHQYLTQEILNLYKENKTYDILTLKRNNIFGSNELYDYETELYHFSVECISEEAVIFFLSKKNLSSIINKEKSLYESLTRLVEFRVKDIIGKMKFAISNFQMGLQKKMKIKNMKINLTNTIIYSKEKQTTKLTNGNFSFYYKGLYGNTKKLSKELEERKYSINMNKLNNPVNKSDYYNGYFLSKTEDQKKKSIKLGFGYIPNLNIMSNTHTFREKNNDSKENKIKVNCYKSSESKKRINKFNIITTINTEKEKKNRTKVKFFLKNFEKNINENEVSFPYLDINNSNNNNLYKVKQVAGKISERNIFPKVFDKKLNNIHIK